MVKASLGRARAVAAPVVYPVALAWVRRSPAGMVSCSMLSPGVRCPVLLMPSTVTLYCTKCGEGGFAAPVWKEASVGCHSQASARLERDTKGTWPTVAPGSSPCRLTVAVLLGKLRDLHVMQPNFLKEYMYCSREGGICWLGKPAASTRPPAKCCRSVCKTRQIRWWNTTQHYCTHGAAANNAYPWQRT